MGFNIPYHGVNLGDWLIPENWMSHVFDGVVAWDLHSLVDQIGQAEATKRVEHHRSTFMNEGDFNWLANHGINSVRLAFGYWDVENTTDYPTGGLRWIDQAFEWCNKYNITVMLDFHGLPGSQNADAHSGTTAGIAFHLGDNPAHALRVVDFVVRRYKDHPMYIGIDLANEPVTAGPDGLNNGKPAIPVDILKKYYTDAYSLIRKVDVKGWVVFDTPYGPYPAADPMNWWQFMTEKEYLRTMNDYHYYQLYTSAQVGETMDEHVNELADLAAQFIAIGQKRPMMVGEWSFALPDFAYKGMTDTQHKAAREVWAVAQLKVYEHWTASYFYNYKSDVEDENWSFTTVIREDGWPRKDSTLAQLPYSQLHWGLITKVASQTGGNIAAFKISPEKKAARARSELSELAPDPRGPVAPKRHASPRSVTTAVLRLPTVHVSGQSGFPHFLVAAAVASVFVLAVASRVRRSGSGPHALSK